MMMRKTVFSVLLLKQNAKKKEEKNQLVNAHHSATLKHIEDF